MKTFTEVHDRVEDLLAHYKDRGMPKYACVTGRLEMSLVFVLDFIKKAYGKEAYEEAIKLSRLKIDQ